MIILLGMDFSHRLCKFGGQNKLLKIFNFKDYDTILYFITAISTLWLAIVAQISSRSWSKQNNLKKRFELANSLLSAIVILEKVYLKYIKDKAETNDSLIISEFEKISKILQPLIYDYKIIEPKIISAIEYFLKITIDYYYIDFCDIGEKQMAPEQCYIWHEWRTNEDKNSQKKRNELETHIKEIKDICTSDIKKYYGVSYKKV